MREHWETVQVSQILTSGHELGQQGGNKAHRPWGVCVWRHQSLGGPGGWDESGWTPVGQSFIHLAWSSDIKSSPHLPVPPSVGDKRTGLERPLESREGERSLGGQGRVNLIAGAHTHSLALLGGLSQAWRCRDNHGTTPRGHTHQRRQTAKK